MSALPPRRILVVEDDTAIRLGLVDALRATGHDVLDAACVQDTRRLGLRGDLDLILLDLVLPDGDGLDLLRLIRETRLPVILITARGTEADRVCGLDLGADDYVVKPFGVREVLARIGAVLRRSSQRTTIAPAIQLPPWHIDLQRFQATHESSGQIVELTEREVELLRWLASHPDRPVDRSELLEYVWRVDPHHNAQGRAVEMAVARLRSKLGDDSEHPALILNIRGRGYLLASSPLSAKQDPTP